MSRLFKSFAVGFFIITASSTFAQESQQKSESKEIIIQKNGGDNENISIEINGDNVMINGKPYEKSEGGPIIRRKVIINGKTVEDYNSEDVKTDSITVLGVTTEDVDNGVKITEVMDESAASKAGLKEGDVITTIDDEKIATTNDLSKKIRAHHPKDQVIINYIRNGKSKSTKATLQVQLKKRNKENNLGFNFDIPGIEDLSGLKLNLNQFPKKEKLGIKIQDTEDENGVKIIGIADSSLAMKSGLKLNDIVFEIDGVKINNTDDARQTLQQTEDKSSYQLHIKRGNETLMIEVCIPKKLKTADL